MNNNNKTNNISLAIVGAGRWGKNHVKTANGLLSPEQITICDFSEIARETVAGINPKINFTTDFDSIISNKEINAVIIAISCKLYIVIFCCLGGLHYRHDARTVDTSRMNLGQTFLRSSNQEIAYRQLQLDHCQRI